MIENMTSIKQLFLLDVALSMLFDHILTQKSVILDTLSKFHLSIKVSISSTYLLYLEIIQLNHLYQIILKIRNDLLFVIDITNQLEVQYSVLMNLVFDLEIDSKIQDS